jgi:hypothetical protein
MRVQISHDAFSRESLERETLRTHDGCSWCGENRHGRLFVYYLVPDDAPGKAHIIGANSTKYSTVEGKIPAFCCIQCMRSFVE